MNEIISGGRIEDQGPTGFCRGVFCLRVILSVVVMLVEMLWKIRDDFDDDGRLDSIAPYVGDDFLGDVMLLG